MRWRRGGLLRSCLAGFSVFLAAAGLLRFALRSAKDARQAPKETEVKDDLTTLPPRPLKPARTHLMPKTLFLKRSFPPRRFVETPKPPDPVPPLTVLDWTGFYNAPLEDAFKDLMAKCPEEPKCLYTNDRSRLNESAGVIFHLRDMSPDWDDLPAGPRDPRQVFVLFSFEPPPLTYVDLKAPQAQSFFNWSMSYRPDSNVQVPHGLFFTEEGGEGRWGDWLPKLRKKTKGVAWFASNCVTDSEREIYVEALKEHIQVDVFGSCGPNKCPKRGAGSECEGQILRDYKFYLAFENSVCNGYITEKFFRYLAQYNVLPIVLSRSVMRGVAPPESFLAADDFASPQSLATELTRLNGDQAAFEAHFGWLKTQRLMEGFETDHLHFCQLCRKLHAQPKPPATFTRRIPDPHNFWYTRGQCRAGFAAGLVNRATGGTEGSLAQLADAGKTPADTQPQPFQLRVATAPPVV